MNKNLNNSVYLDVPSIQYSYRQKFNQLYKDFEENNDTDAPKKPTQANNYLNGKVLKFKDNSGGDTLTS